MTERNRTSFPAFLCLSVVFLIKCSRVFFNRKKLVMSVQGKNWGKFKALFHLRCGKQRCIIKRRLKQNWKKRYKRWKLDKSSEARDNRNKVKIQSPKEEQNLQSQCRKHPINLQLPWEIFWEKVPPHLWILRLGWEGLPPSEEVFHVP